MQVSLRKRLANLEQRINPIHNRAVIYVHESQSESAQSMIARWKAGEEVEEIKGPPYQEDYDYLFAVFVATRKRKNGEGVECVHTPKK